MKKIISMAHTKTDLRKISLVKIFEKSAIYADFYSFINNSSRIRNAKVLPSFPYIFINPSKLF